MEEIIIISLGGSLIAPENLDLDFLRDFKALILSFIVKGKKFVIVTGGGKICRRYQDTAKNISSPSNEDLNLIGIASLRLNAELLRVIFDKYAYKRVINNLAENLSFDKPIVIGAADVPGRSTDFNAT